MKKLSKQPTEDTTRKLLIFFSLFSVSDKQNDIKICSLGVLFYFVFPGAGHMQEATMA